MEAGSGSRLRHHVLPAASSRRLSWLVIAALAVTTTMAASGCGNRSSAPTTVAGSQPPAYFLGTDHGLGEMAVEKRFSTTVDPIDRATLEFGSGELATSLDLLNSLPTDIQAERRWLDLHSKVQQAEDGREKKSAVEDVAYRITTYWEPQLRDRPISAPTTTEELWAEETFLEVMAKNLDMDVAETVSGERQQLPPSAVAARKRFRSEIAARQAKVLPMLRRAYVQLLAAKLWPDNVIVTGAGKTINFTGAIFADNASIQASEQAAQQDLRKLRFARSHYAWCKGCGGYSYDLESPSDASLVEWAGASFRPVD